LAVPEIPVIILILDCSRANWAFGPTIPEITTFTFSEATILAAIPAPFKAL
jgi:hypothetical protein